MDLIVAGAVGVVLVAWAVVGYAIWRWGPGRGKRSVRCPITRVRAKLLVEQTEGDFGSLRVSDVLACSLLPEGPVTCGKKCLTQF